LKSQELRVTIEVRLFAHMASFAATKETQLELQAGARLIDVRPALEAKFPGIPWAKGTLLAINQEYAAPEQELHTGDEVAIIPPVSGG
jgi:molybdopterin converting factor small subunit